MRRLLLAAALSLLTAAPAMAQHVILVRHAEKADQSQDPVLSEAGEARARALAAAISEFTLDEALVTPLRRTQLTAAPAAQADSVVPAVIGFDGGTAAHVSAVVDRVKALPEDATVLVVGHSNTIPLIARGLGVEAADMPDCEYDRLTILLLDGDSSVVVNNRYGDRSTC